MGYFRHGRKQDSGGFDYLIMSDAYTKRTPYGMILEDQGSQSRWINTAALINKTCPSRWESGELRSK